jgi:hypothetical protein
LGGAAQLLSFGNAMSQTVAHYLSIYRQRQRMAVSGVAKPSAEARSLIDQLVTRLSDLEPSLPCHTTKTKGSDGSLWIAVVVEGQELARLQIDPKFDI